MSSAVGAGQFNGLLSNWTIQEQAYFHFSGTIQLCIHFHDIPGRRDLMRDTGLALSHKHKHVQ